MSETKVDRAARLEVVRVLREQCSMVASGPLHGDPWIVRAAEAALDTPVEEMAAWVDLGDTVMNNVRAIMRRVESQRVIS